MPVKSHMDEIIRKWNEACSLAAKTPPCGTVTLWRCRHISYMWYVVFMCGTTAITRLRTRCTAVRHWLDLGLSAYERDFVTNEKVWFRNFVPNRRFEDSFFSCLASIEQHKEAVKDPRWACRVYSTKSYTCTCVSGLSLSFNVFINAKPSEKSLHWIWLIHMWTMLYSYLGHA